MKSGMCANAGYVVVPKGVRPLENPRGSDPFWARRIVANVAMGICFLAFVPNPSMAQKDEAVSPPGKSLSRDEAETLVAEVWQTESEAVRASLAAELDNGAIILGERELKILEKTFGEAPEKGHSLWISMHGGGGAPARVNDQQWKNQIRLYEPEEGIYVAPRAPTNSWNLWHEGHIDPLFDRMITAYVVARGVNPDRVYLMGYSAGGDGVYQLAPRMADRFAAASMMAGHPNESQPDGLRNLPFALYVGGKDAAYDRNQKAPEWGKKLDELQEKDPGGYTHRLTVYPEKGHWMDGEDKDSLPWMAAYTRNPWPKKIVWRQDDIVHSRFYWIGVDADSVKAGQKLEAEVCGQTITITSEDVKKVTIYLRDSLVNLDEPVVVDFNGHQILSGKVARTRNSIEESLRRRPDPGLAATAILQVEFDKSR